MLKEGVRKASVQPQLRSCKFLRLVLKTAEGLFLNFPSAKLFLFQ